MMIFLLLLLSFIDFGMDPLNSFRKKFARRSVVLDRNSVLSEIDLLDPSNPPAAADAAAEDGSTTDDPTEPFPAATSADAATSTSTGTTTPTTALVAPIDIIGGGGGGGGLSSSVPVDSASFQPGESTPTPETTSGSPSSASPNAAARNRMMSFDRLPKPPQKPAAAKKKPVDQLDKDIGEGKDYWAEVLSLPSLPSPLCCCLVCCCYCLVFWQYALIMSVCEGEVLAGWFFFFSIIFFQLKK